MLSLVVSSLFSDFAPVTVKRSNMDLSILSDCDTYFCIHQFCYCIVALLFTHCFYSFLCVLMYDLHYK